MKKFFGFLSVSVFVLLLADLSYGQLQVVQLGESSLQNNKTFVIDDSGIHQRPIELKVKAVNKGEPAMSPMELSIFIRCHNEKSKPIDLGGYLIKAYGDKVSHFVGRKTKLFPSGVVKVCSLENVNFDQDKIFISVLGGGSQGCQQKEVIDFILPIEDFCAR